VEKCLEKSIYLKFKEIEQTLKEVKNECYHCKNDEVNIMIRNRITGISTDIAVIERVLEKELDMYKDEECILMM